MNANELADAMEIRASIRRKATSRKSVTEGANDRLADQLEQAATMLRQQEVEIERITSKHEEMLKEMLEKTNEPVAWMDDLSFFTEQPDDMDGVTPLYTHPIKELTDEEIEQISDDHIDWVYETGDIDFARAILRKAQEK